MTTAIVHSDREQWLARRRELITASDCAAILGADERRSPFAVWAEKTGAIEVEEHEEMLRGRDFEDAIGRAYGRQTARPVFAPEHLFEITVHPDLPWLGATLDRLTFDPSSDGLGPVTGKAPLQIKKADGSRNAWRDGPPVPYEIQVAVEVACYGATWGALAAYVGPGPLATFDLPRNEEFLRKAIPLLEAFLRLVQTRTPPEADGSASTSAALRALYPDEDGETVVLDEEAMKLHDEMEAHRLLVEAEEEQARAAGNKLRARLGSASFGRLPDGSFLRLKTINRRAYTRTVEAGSYRRLTRESPKLRRR